MSKIFTKLSSLALATAVVGSGFSVNANAAELESQVLDSNEFKNEVFYETQENVGVNDVGPGLGDPNVIVPFGTSKPTSTWDLSTKGIYTFDGSSSGPTLYTNYLLTGKSSVEIYATNQNNQFSLKFKLKRKDLIFDSTIKSFEIPAGKDGTFTVPSLDTSSNYYLEFSPPNKFYGYIK
ncbi:hypothetical protein ABFY60_01160 [Lysinibacillus pakistanensis]|uniref:hypothetical protein n=1 Tax=Lysinibacillus pakistanensis TaxID=759811 RepID=UPI003D296A55